MKPERRHNYRAPVAVVAGIIDVLHSGSDIDSAPNMRRVIRLDDVLPPVVQPSISQQETEAAIGQIHLVILLDPVRHERNAGTVLLAMPQCAICPDTLIERRINFGVGKRLGFSVVPSPAGIRRDVSCEILLHVDAKAIFTCDAPDVVCDVRDWDQVLLILRNRITIDAHIGVVRISQQPDDLAAASSDAAEREGVVKTIGEWRSAGVPAEQIAVLARRNIDVRNIALELKKQGIRAVTSGLLTAEGAGASWIRTNEGVARNSDARLAAVVARFWHHRSKISAAGQINSAAKALASASCCDLGLYRERPDAPLLRKAEPRIRSCAAPTKES
jgi:hypothetical protein